MDAQTHNRNQVIAEIDQALSLLESRLPGSLEKPVNQKLVSRFEKDMAGYFKALSDALPFDRIEALYFKNVSQG